MSHFRTESDGQLVRPRAFILSFLGLALILASVTALAKPQVSWIQESWACESTETNGDVAMSLRLWYPEAQVVILNWTMTDCRDVSCVTTRAQQTEFVPVPLDVGKLTGKGNFAEKESWPPLKQGASLVGNFADSLQRKLTILEVEEAKYPSWFMASLQIGDDEDKAIELSCLR